MIIRRYSNGNQYIRAGNVWVRNFTKDKIAAFQPDHLFESKDYGLVLQNEQMNTKYPRISDETIKFDKVVIVSDGYRFEDRHLFISKLAKDVCVLAVNKALNKWKLLDPKITDGHKRTINAYVVNNPYRESLLFMPPKDSRYFPACISSTRTNHEFLKKYLGDVYVYKPTLESSFGFESNENYHIDDYRNPICACIDLAHHFGAKKIMLVCCDDSFEEKRESSVKLTNGLWTYPQHIRSHEIIDAKLYWLTHQEDREVKVSDYSSGPEYVNAVYINNEEEALSFFTDHEEGTPNE